MKVWRYCNIINMLSEEEYAYNAYWRMMDWLGYLSQCCMRCQIEYTNLRDMPSRLGRSSGDWSMELFEEEPFQYLLGQP